MVESAKPPCDSELEDLAEEFFATSKASKRATDKTRLEIKAIWMEAWIEGYKAKYRSL